MKQSTEKTINSVEKVPVPVPYKVTKIVKEKVPVVVTKEVPVPVTVIKAPPPPPSEAPNSSVMHAIAEANKASAMDKVDQQNTVAKKMERIEQ